MPDQLAAPPPGGWPRIAVVCHTHPSISKGGAEIAAYGLFQGLRGLGLDAIFVAACAETDRGRLHFETPHEFAVFHDQPRYDHLYHSGSPAVARALARLLAEQRIGLANFHHFLFLGLGALETAKRLAGVTSVLTLHEYLAICQHHGQMVTRPARALCDGASAIGCGDCFPEFQRPQLILRRERFLAAFGAVDRFISPSAFLADRYAAWGLEREHISVVENGLLGHQPLQRPARERRPGAPWVFGYFGQITRFKGMDVLLDACDAIAADEELARRLHIRIHGSLVGQTTEFAERFAAAVKQHPFLSFAGAYTNPSVGRLMGECDWVVVPSTWWENSPMVIQEAFAARRPVLCSGIGGMAEKVPEGVAGRHFRPGDAVSLVDAIRGAMDEDGHAALLQTLPTPFDEAEMARRYLRCFAAALRPAEATAA
jgi:glycosyltransferase involved in cell wall biosynthesis